MLVLLPRLGSLRNAFGEQQDNSDAFYVFVTFLLALPGFALLALAAGAWAAAHMMHRGGTVER